MCKWGLSGSCWTACLGVEPMLSMQQHLGSPPAETGAGPNTGSMSVERGPGVFAYSLSGECLRWLLGAPPCKCDALRALLSP